MGRGFLAAPPLYRLGSELGAVENFRTQVFDEVYNDLLMLACNVVTIEEHPDNIPIPFVLRTLYEQGQIGYYNHGNHMSAYAVGGAGNIDIYGNPEQYLLIPKTGNTLRVKANDAKLAVVWANGVKHKLSDSLAFAAARIADCEVAITVNLLNTQTNAIVEVENDEQVTSLKSAMRQKMAGVPAIYARKGDIATSIAKSANAQNINAPYIADKIAELRDQYRQHALAQIAVLTANRGKRERVQSAEVNAGVGEVIDYVYCLIDQYNADCARQNLPYRMQLNASVADMYTDGKNDSEREVNADV